MIKQLKRLLYHIPTKLPQGVTSFNAWSTDIIETYEMPNNDSVKFAIAVAILHLKSDQGYVPKSYFGKILIKGASSQIAQVVMQECKARQELLIKAEQEAAAAQQVEATASQDESASNVQPN